MKPPSGRARIDMAAMPRVALAARGRHGTPNGPSVERYHLPQLWTLHAYSYHATIVAAGIRLTIRPGSVSLFPPATELAYHYPGEVTHQYAHFEMLSSPAVAPCLHDLPLMCEMGADFSRFESAVAQLANYTFAPERAGIRLWELLWQLCDRQEAGSRRMHPSLQNALVAIEAQLSQPISIKALARQSGISHNQLTRLFAAEFGTTAVAYLRRRRSERAIYLLSQTSLPIKNVATQVGVPDLRQFGAMVKRESGASPRVWRQEAGKTVDWT